MHEDNIQTLIMLIILFIDIKHGICNGIAMLSVTNQP